MIWSLLRSVVINHGGKFLNHFKLTSDIHVDILRSPGAGSLIASGINGGSMLYVSPDNANAFEHDRMMKETCCGIAQLCHLYYQRRPFHDCTGYEPPVRSECHVFHT